MNLMRFTVVEPTGTASFILHGDALPAFLAACAHNPTDLPSLLTSVDRYYHDLHEHVTSALAVFDEHNSQSNPAAIHGAFDFLPPHELPPFRVIDERTREESLRPVKAGVVVFNLLARRIVQIQNTYHRIQRRGRGRVYEGGRLTNRTFIYRLPEQWALVP